MPASPLTPEAYCEQEADDLNSICEAECESEDWVYDACHWEDEEEVEPCTLGTQVKLTCKYVEP